MAGPTFNGFKPSLSRSLLVSSIDNEASDDELVVALSLEVDEIVALSREATELEVALSREEDELEVALSREDELVVALSRETDGAGGGVGDLCRLITGAGGGDACDCFAIFLGGGDGETGLEIFGGGGAVTMITSSLSAKYQDNI